MQTAIIPHVKLSFHPSFSITTFANKKTMKAQTTHPVSYSSVEQMPNAKGSALFITDSSKVFKDDIDITPHFNLDTESRWEKYHALRDAVIPVEEFFATQYLSKKLLEVLRSEVLTRRYRSTSHKTVCRILQAVEIRCLLSGDPTASMHFEHDALFDIVNSIRNKPEEFPEWHSSATAELYDPAVFENKKDSLGYWF